MRSDRSSKARYRAFLAGRERESEADPSQTSADSHSQPENEATPGGRKRGKGYFREYLAWINPFRFQIITILALALSAAVLSLALPRATMLIIDEVLPSGDAGRLHRLGIGLLLIIIVQQTIDLLRNWRQAKLNARLVFRLRQRLYAHLLKLPLHRLYNLKTGGITSRLSGDVDSVTGIVQLAIITPGVAGAKVLLTLGILLWISWKLAVAATLLLPIIIALNLLYTRRIRPIYRSMRRDRGEIDARVVETFGGIRVVRAFHREKTEARRYAVRHHAVIRKSLRAQMLEFVVWSGWGFLIPLAGLVIIWYGGALTLRGDASIGAIIAFQMYMMMLLMPVSAIVKSFGDMQHALAALERVFDLLREPADKPDRPGARIASRHVESFELRNVTFSYDTGSPVLSDFSLVVPGGSTVALVGPSGAGKTTVTNLVARFYDPREGALLLNGVDLRDYTLSSYRRLLGLVQQDVFLFDGTVAENIAYGRPGASDDEIIDAARRANAHNFIEDLPQGYQTLVGERGVRLSGGQAQRVSIARAILADPQILILDEATSSLDTESELLIQASLRVLLANRTTFVIAHRLSTVVGADMIVVLEAGRIVETGTHNELMASSGIYREMVERQQWAFDAPQPLPESQPT